MANQRLLLISLLIAALAVILWFRLSTTFPTIMAVSPTPPATGNWVINATNSPAYCTDDIITLNGNLTVQAGGDLTFSNCTLRMNVTSNGEYVITVEPDGIMTIDNSSNITRGDQDAAYLFFVDQGANFSLKNSYVSHAGYAWGTAGELCGLYIKSNNTLINNTTFTANMCGVVLRDLSPVAIMNSEFHNNTYGAVAHLQPTLGMSGQAVNDSLACVRAVYQVNLSLQGNIAYNNSYAFYVLYNMTNNSFSHNRCFNNTYGIVEDYDINLLFDSNTAHHNTYAFFLSHILDRNNIINNTLGNNSNGIVADFAMHEMFYNNTAYNNTHSFYIQYMLSDNVISYNTAWGGTTGLSGIYTIYTALTNNSARNNTGYGFYINYTSSGNDYTNNTAYSNALGYQLIYNKTFSLVNNTAINNNVGALLSSSYNGTFANNSAHHNIDGVRLVHNPAAVTFLDNIITDNVVDVAVIRQPNDRYINNNIYSNVNGFYVFATSNDTIMVNQIVNNTGYGLVLNFSYNNTVAYNALADNGINLFVNMPNEIANQSLVLEGALVAGLPAARSTIISLNDPELIYRATGQTRAPKNISTTVLETTKITDPAALAPLPANMTNLTSYQINISTEAPYICMNYSGTGFTDASVYQLVDGTWTELSDVILSTATAVVCGNVSSTPYLIVGFTPAVCNNDICEIGESCETCPADCGPCPLIVQPLPKGYSLVDMSGSFSLARGDWVDFEIAGVSHRLTLIDLGARWAVLDITSGTLRLNLTLNESRRVDIDGDNVDDIEVMLTDIAAGRASIMLLELPPLLECPVCPEPGAWSACIERAQIRIAWYCGPETNWTCAPRTESRACAPPEVPLVPWPVIAAAAVAAAIAWYALLRLRVRPRRRLRRRA
jgi:parallel beta-helix repeat protein